MSVDEYVVVADIVDLACVLLQVSLPVARSLEHCQYLSTSHDRDISRGFTALSFEHIFKVRRKIFLQGPCLPHRFSKCTARRLASFPHICNLGVAFDVPEIVHDALERCDLCFL